MKKLLALGFLLAALFVAPIEAAPLPGGTITLLTAQPIVVGQNVSFDYTLSGGVNECPNGGSNKCARIDINCNKVSDNSYLYGAAYPAVHPTTFPLPYTQTVWYDSNLEANCVAALYYWDFHPTQIRVVLAEINFHVYPY